MKYTSVMAAAAVLSASTFALDAKFSLGVEASNFILDGTRSIGELSSVEDIDESLTFGDITPSTQSVFASKEILGLKASASMKMSDRFSLEAGVVVNSGSLENQMASSGVFVESDDSAVFLYKENISTTIKPTYGFGVKAMFGFNDSFKIGPEVRIQRFETTHSGNLLTTAVDSDTTNDDITGEFLTSGGGTANAISEDEVTTTETSFGLALSGMLNDKIAVNAGYLTVKAQQHVVTVTDALAESTTALMTGGTDGETSFNLESEEPTIDQYYVGLSMSF